MSEAFSLSSISSLPLWSHTLKSGIRSSSAGLGGAFSFARRERLSFSLLRGEKCQVDLAGFGIGVFRRLLLVSIMSSRLSSRPTRQTVELLVPSASLGL